MTSLSTPKPPSSSASTAAPAESMALTGSRLERIKDEYGAKGARYLAVTVVNVTLGQSLLALSSAGFGWTYVQSNLFAVCLSAGPAYLLSRQWVWQKTGKSHFLKEVVPFWSLAFLGLIVSTLFASIAARYSDSTLVLMATNFTAFGVVWVAKFFILEVLFKNELVDEVPHAKLDPEPPEGQS